jgi:MFS family permease
MGDRRDIEGEWPETGDESGRLSPAPPVGPSGGWPARLARHLVVDIGPLRRHRDFRLLWVGRAISLFGSMVTYVAIPYQAYQLTHSSLIVGLLSAVEFATLLVMPLIGGALSDAVDRRRLVLLSELLLAGASVVLLVNALAPEPRLWVLFAAAGLIAAFDGLQRPPLDALLPRLVGRDELAAAGWPSSPPAAYWQRPRAATRQMSVT